MTDGVVLKDFQREAVDGVFGAFDGGEQSCLVVMPTGTGKTYVFSAVAGRFAPKRTLVLAHRGELLTQAAATLGRFGLGVSVEKAAERADPRDLYAPVVVASVQTMRGDRLARWPRDAFALVVVDEAHHALAPTYKRVLGHFSTAKLLGVTATPERGDGDKLGTVFPTLAFEYKLRDAITEGHLVRLRIERPATKVDLSKIRTTAGDLNQGDLEDEISKHIEELVNSTKERIGDRPAIVFTPDVGSAIAFADGLRQVGVAARFVSGESEDRDTVFSQFKAGDFQVLANCMLATEGFDCPRVSAIVLARPTKSGVLYRQMVGRGTRLCEDKADCLVVDFAWNSGKHSLVSPVELFDTQGTDAEVLEAADELIRSGRETDPLRAMEEAERIHRQQVAFRVSVRERASTYRFVAFDPFAVGEVLGVPRRRVTSNVTPATVEQQRRLDKVFRTYEIDYSAMSRGYAAKLLGEIDHRREQGLATHRQVAALIANGVDQDEARAMTFEDASGELDRLIGGKR